MTNRTASMMSGLKPSARRDGRLVLRDSSAQRNLKQAVRPIADSSFLRVDQKIRRLQSFQSAAKLQLRRHGYANSARSKRREMINKSPSARQKREQISPELGRRSWNLDSMELRVRSRSESKVSQKGEGGGGSSLRTGINEAFLAACNHRS